MNASIFDNFRLLIAEVRKQVEDTRALVLAHDAGGANRIHERDNYVDTMKGILHNHVFKAMIEQPDMGKSRVDVIRAVGVVTDNLENIADFCTHIADQLHYLKKLEKLDEFALERYFDEILAVFDLIEPAVLNGESTSAFRICNAEFHLDSLYKGDFDRILKELEDHGPVGDLITILFIIRYLERAGDALLNIGEAALSSILGEKFKIHQVSVLDRAAAELEGLEGRDAAVFGGMEDAEAFPEMNVEYHTLAETRSGCRIGRIRNTARRGQGNWTLYKEGPIAKILQEKKNLERWEEVFPGLVPHIVKYDESGGVANLLLEYITGSTFQEVLLEGDAATLDTAVRLLFSLLENIWQRTLVPEDLASGFVPQLRGRLHEILTLHPDFNLPSVQIGDKKRVSLPRRVALLEQLESQLVVPFSVFIHGDFNNDNVIVTDGKNAIRLIDVNRSRRGDYLQDVTVFLVSNFRLPTFVPEVRQRIRTVSRRMLAFAREFAASRDDRFFEVRMGLGVCRSFLTSTRFVPHRGFARELYRRALYLTDRLLDAPSPEAFRFPDAVLLE